MAKIFVPSLNCWHEVVEHTIYEQIAILELVLTDRIASAEWALRNNPFIEKEDGIEFYHSVTDGTAGRLWDLKQRLLEMTPYVPALKGIERMAMLPDEMFE